MNDKEEKEFDRHHKSDLVKAICSVACAVREFTEHSKAEFEWSKSHPHLATKQDLDRMEGRIMGTVKEYIEASNAKFTELATAADELEASQAVITAGVTGVAGDIAFVKAKLEEIQNNPGPISAEDQAALNAGLDRLNGLSTRYATHATALKAQADAIKALDEATTPDQIPTPPGEGESGGGGSSRR